MQLSTFVNDVHQNARTKGWYDGEPRKPAEMHQLMISEIAEATEEVRAGKPAVYILNDEKQVVAIESLDFASFTVINGDVVSHRKPEGEAVELADCVIRVFDYFGSKQWDIDQAERDFYEAYGHGPDHLKESMMRILKDPDHTALVAHRGMVACIIEAYSQDESVERLGLMKCIKLVEMYFLHKNWDFETVLRIKHAYNTTRPYRHGNKLV